MEILRKYRHFINESVDTNKEVKSLTDVPQEVMDIAKKIALDMFDRVRKPIFDIEQGVGLIMKFSVTEQDFQYANDSEPLTIDLTENARKKRNFDVSLSYYDSISETYEVQYIVTFESVQYEPFINDDDTDDDVFVKDDYDKEDHEDYFDEDIADQQIKKGKIKIEDHDIEDFDDEDDDF